MAQGPEKKGAQVVYPAGQGRVGVGVPVLVPAGVVEGDAPVDTAGDEVRENVDAGLPDTDDVADNAELPDTNDGAVAAGEPNTDGVVEGDAVPEADGVGEPEDEGALGVGVGDCRTATQRLVMVALDTPASLASQL